MARIKLSGIVTANDLLGGHVIYLNGDGEWTPNISESHIYPPEQSESALSSVESHSDRVVGAYWSEVEISSAGTITPVHFREKFRAVGFGGGVDVSI